MDPHRAAAVLFALAALFLSGALASAAHQAAPVLRPSATKTFSGQGLSADGQRAAVGDPSGSPLLWDAATGRTFPLAPSCDERTAETTIAGRQFAFVCIQATNTTSFRELEAGILGGRTYGLASSGYLCAENCVGNVAGDGHLLVFNTSNRLQRKWRLWRIIDGRRKRLLRADSTSSEVMAVDAGRIVVKRSGRHYEMLNAGGDRIGTYHVDTRFRILLNGNSLVARTATGIMALDVRTGSVEHRWRISGRARLEDVEGGWLVYVVGTTIHFLRLVDGHDVAVPLAHAAPPVHAQLEPPGLFYTVGDLVAFVPRVRLEDVLR